MEKLKKIKIDLPNCFLYTLFAALQWIVLFYVIVSNGSFNRQLFPAIATFLFTTSLLVLFNGVFGKFHIAVLTHNLLIAIFSFIHYFSIQLRGTIFFMSDVYNIKTGMNVANQYSLKFDGCFWVSLLCFASICALAWIFKHKNFKNTKKRIATLLLGLVMTVGSVFLMIFIENTFSYNQFFNGYANNGYIYEFIGTMDVRLREPNGYNKKDYQDTIGASYTEEMKDKNPNVIVIMSESFVDSDIYDFGETEDLMPFIHSLKNEENCVSGNIYSSVIGGMTACMEFEALTGHSCYFSKNIVQYTAYMKGGNNYGSVARVFNDLGYKTTAFHPYYKSGYNRQCAYETMGFNNYIGIENLKDAESGLTIPGRTFVSDEYTYAKIMETIGTTEERDFMLCVTMQNHGGYDEKELTNISKVTNTGTDSLDNYLYLLSVTDSSTEKWIEELKQFDEPTVVVFFGDHQPQEMASASKTDQFKIYETPYFIWANFDIDTNIENTEFTSANFLMPIMFEAVWGKQPTGWYKYLSALRKEYPVISQNVVLDINNKLVKPKLAEYEKRAYYAVWEQSK